jgi:hypothetical protein
MKTLSKILLAAALLAGIQMTTFGQCKTFTKNECRPKLDPYIYNGQLNNAVLNEGDIAELMLTFYSNQEYRVLVCAAEELGKVNFRLLDMERNEIFSNKDHNNVEYWDFMTNSTQQLIVEVHVPETSEGESYVSGCVSILVGFMDNKK